MLATMRGNKILIQSNRRKRAGKLAKRGPRAPILITTDKKKIALSLMKYRIVDIESIVSISKHGAVW